MSAEPGEIRLRRSRGALGKLREESQRGLWRTLDHVTWVSHPDSIRAAGSKAEQLLRAKRLGFSIPRSCFSKDPEEVAAFCERLGGPQRVIYKPHNPMMFSLPQTARLGVVYATPLDDSDLSRLEEVRVRPGIFQERIESGATSESRSSAIG